MATMSHDNRHIKYKRYTRDKPRRHGGLFVAGAELLIIGLPGL